MIHLVTKTKIIQDTFPLATIKESLDYCSDLKEVCLDLETTGINFLDDKIIFLIIGDKYNQYVIDSTVDYSIYKDLIESKLIIGHNLKFDYKFLKHIGIHITKLYDTFTSECLVNQGFLRSDEKEANNEEEILSSALDKVVERYTKNKLHKSTRKAFIGMSPLNYKTTHISYAANDILYLEQIKEAQIKHLTKYKELNTLNLENNIVIPLAEMEYEGMKLDKNKWLDLYKDNLIIKNDLIAKLDEELINTPKLKKFVPKYIQRDLFSTNIRKVNINWDSPKQCLSVFKTLIPNLESTSSVELVNYSTIHIVEIFLKYKEITKLTTTYGKDFFKYIYSDGRVHTNFKQIINTGRMSSSNPNMQQIPSDNRYRNCFIPNYKDWVFVSSDYSSQELALAAYDSGDKVWLNALKEGKDLHSICAELLFGEEWKNAAEDNCQFYVNNQKCKCKEHKKLRTFAKTIDFGLNYYNLIK